MDCGVCGMDKSDVVSKTCHLCLAIYILLNAFLCNMCSHQFGGSVTAFMHGLYHIFIFNGGA